jgi:hypothetical protein
MNTTFNRRTFLKGSAAAATFLPTFNILSQQNGITIGPKDDDIKVAVIGYGAEGQILTEAASGRITRRRPRAHSAPWVTQQTFTKITGKCWTRTERTLKL